MHKGKEVKGGFGKELPVNSVELLEYGVKAGDVQKGDEGGHGVQGASQVLH